MATYITIGKIGSTYGVHGWVKISAYTQHESTILDYNPWFLLSGSHNWQAIQVEEGRPHGKGIIVKLAGYNSPEAARALTGKAIGIKREQLPPLSQDEYYWTDLEGSTVINQDNLVIGKVSYLLETGSNDVLVVKGEKEFAIPFLLGTVITKVDLDAKTIYVDWELI